MNFFHRAQPRTDISLSKLGSVAFQSLRMGALGGVMCGGDHLGPKIEQVLDTIWRPLRSEKENLKKEKKEEKKKRKEKKKGNEKMRKK